MPLLVAAGVELERNWMTSWSGVDAQCFRPPKILGSFVADCRDLTSLPG